ncbi:hypothetical protein TanjilG_04335 [Lupinus angustifolius]|uniref:AT-hook motif nuclear-localized protein n=1 Tax=Lupinus angustifolius TaxID=3871 RepID=A0A4P1RQ81_LUPAN|nr:PREDICTED: AT-hook motif nuclear-localized protein 9-like [Lupinus angustifolius]OIW15800.1 hypothetical protein TanjilG_04335 [Lupinus angustifolius]
METQVTQSSTISIQTEPPKTQVLDQKMTHANEDSSVLASEQKVKRKRGRPRKYDVNGNVLSSTYSMPSSDDHAIGSSSKRSRGRPRGSTNKHIITSTLAETSGGSFKPHVITVNKGEDVVKKILAFSEKNVPKAAVSVISATGSVSSVLFRNTNHSSIQKLEGCFEIVSLSGSYIFGADGDSLCKKGMFTILLSEPDGRIFGGILESSMIAATPIQLIVASFKQNTSKKTMKMQVPSIVEATRIPAENLIHATTTTTTTIGVSDNVIVANQNMKSEPINGVGLDIQAMQPITDQSIGAADNNANV